VGFTNDVTVAVWVGYDNADGKRRTLGSGQTGATVAIPVFQPIMEAVWAYHVPKAALAPPSPEARRNLVTRRVDLEEASDDPANPPKSLVEYFRRDASGRVSDTQYDLVSRSEAAQGPTATDGGPFEPWAPWGGRRDSQPPPRQQQQGGWGGFFGWQQPQPQPPAPRYYDPRSPQRPQYDRYPRY
jgi:membrane peptidoglycan carboxypeptidase